MSWLTLLLATTATAQVGPGPELIVPGRYVEPVVSPDGRHVVILDRRHAWLLDGASLRARFGIQTGPYTASGDRWAGASFSSDGSRLALWSLRGATARIDADNGELLSRSPRLEQFMEINGFASPDGRLVARVKKSRLFVSDISLVGDRRPLVFDGYTDGGACFSADGRWLFHTTLKSVERVALRDPSRRLPVTRGSWETIVPTRGAGILLCRSDRLRTVDYETGIEQDLDLCAMPGDEGWRLVGTSARGRLALVASDGARMRALTLPGLELMWEQADCLNPCLAPGADAIWAYDRERRIRVHDIATGELLWSSERSRFARGFFTPASLGSAFLASRADGRLARFERLTGVELPQTGGMHKRMRHAGLFGSGVVWTVDEEGTPAALEPRTGAELARRQPHGPVRWANAAGNRLVVVERDGGGAVYEGERLEILCSFTGGGRAQLIGTGEKLLVYGAGVDGALILNAGDGALLRAIGVGTGQQRRMVASADGTVLAALDAWNIPHLWRDGVEVALPAAAEDLSALALDNRGRWLALGADPPFVQVFDAVSGDLLSAFTPSGWFPFGGDVRTLAFDDGGARLIGTTGDCGMVQVWGTDDWKLDWVHDYGGGNPSSLATTLSPSGGALWVHGMMGSTPRVFELASGEVLTDLSGTELGDFAVGASTVVALRRGNLILLEADGHVRLERVDFGDAGAVILRSGALDGSPAALRGVFVRTGELLLRGDEYAGSLEREGAGAR